MKKHSIQTKVDTAQMLFENIYLKSSDCAVRHGRYVGLEINPKVDNFKKSFVLFGF